jgi:hypothetical protein
MNNFLAVKNGASVSYAQFLEKQSPRSGMTAGAFSLGVEWINMALPF